MAIPIEAGMAIVLWIGVAITAQAFQATPREHAPAVVQGLLPGIGAWGVLMAKSGVAAAAVVAGGSPPDYGAALQDAFLLGGTFIKGAFALEQGVIFNSMVFAAATVHLIECRFLHAAAWCVVGAALSACGFMHSYTVIPGNTVGAFLHPAWPCAIGYLVMAALFASAKWITEPEPGA